MNLKYFVLVKQLAAALAAISVVACASIPANDSARQKLQATWVVLGENGSAIARAVTLDTQCPTIRQDGVAQRMQMRAPATTEQQRATVSKPEDSKPTVFNVLTCEQILDVALNSADIEGVALALPKLLPQKIVVIGDTGCRLQKKDGYFQGCNDANLWAFPAVAKLAASFQPDLVIHVGDYHYRENACPKDDPRCVGSAWGYGWDTWRADFFTPAAPLLAVAPWVMVRGNHESCSRAGQGWWRLMDPRPLVARRDCNHEADDALGDYSAPYAIPLGRIGTELAQLIIFDSSKVPYKALNKADPAYQIYLQQFQIVNQLTEHAVLNLFVNHHPILGFGADPQSDGSMKLFGGSAALQDVMQNLNANRLFPAKVQATISGHVHLFEAITFETDHPAQFISGNGGSSLSLLLPQPLPVGATPFPGARVAHFSNTDEVGLMTMERLDQGWKIVAWNQQGKRLTTCVLLGKKASCSSP